MTRYRHVEAAARAQGMYDAAMIVRRVSQGHSDCVVRLAMTHVAYLLTDAAFDMEMSGETTPDSRTGIEVTE